MENLKGNWKENKWGICDVRKALQEKKGIKEKVGKDKVVEIEKTDPIFDGINPTISKNGHKSSDLSFSGWQLIEVCVVQTIVIFWDKMLKLKSFGCLYE